MPELDELKDKLELSFRLVDTVYLFRNEQVNDLAKRAVSRLLLIQIDNLLVMVPRLKNLIFGNRKSTKRTDLEEAIKVLRRSYDRSYDLIRDKVAAHGQHIEAMACFYAWGGLDYSSTEVLYGDIKQLQSSVEDALDKHFPTIPDYAPLNVAGNRWLSAAAVSHLRFDRFAATQPSTCYMLSLHSSQDKAQLILSLLDFLNVDFAITSIVDGPKSIYQKILFEAGWLMAVIDLCSLVDNLFVDDEYGKSLLTEWRDAEIAGHSDLLRLQESRDLAVEKEIRSTRNKLAAHLDQDDAIQTVIDQYLALDLGKVHSYFVLLGGGFRDACKKDMRTRMFLLHDSPVTSMGKISGKGMPFDDGCR